MNDVAMISKWGNSQGIRLPKSFCDQLNLSIGDKVSVALEGEKIVLAAPTAKYTIKARIQQWDGKRLETKEYDWGGAVGQELW